MIYTKHLNINNIRACSHKADVYNRSNRGVLVCTPISTGSLIRLSAVFSADETAKYKSLLDRTAITQEEYGKKKIDLLN